MNIASLPPATPRLAKISNTLPQSRERKFENKNLRTPTAKQWQAHAGVFVDALIPVSKVLFAIGVVEATRKGVFSAGLGYMAVWPLLETIKEKPE